MALLRRLSTATAVATLALVAAGGLVRATGSGDACPEWPGCFPGRVLPPVALHPLIEFTHRLLVVGVTALIVATAWAAWRRQRRDPVVLWTAVGAVGVVVIQSVIGAIRIEEGPKALLVTLHFMTAMALVALVMVTATAIRVPGRGREPSGGSLLGPAAITLALTGALLLVGAYVRGEGAGLAFRDWPLMDGRVIPDLGAAGTVAAFLHRALAAATVVAGGWLVWRARRAHPGLRALAWIAFGLLVLQTALGAVAVLTRLAPAARAGHVTGAGLAWAALVVLVTAIVRARAPAGGGPRRRVRETVAAYVRLAKPDIIVLLLITTVPAMILAAGGMPRWSLVLATLLGGTLAAAGANAVNCYLDRDIDAVMGRTRGRPIPARVVAPREALRFGIVLVALSFGWLAITVNLPAALVSLLAAAFYVLVYTRWMKRSTPQNIVIGGAAGAAPALVGWAAVTGSLDLPAWILFAIVFFWTPPHFWALAIRHAGEYRAAGVPMLPVVRGARSTAAAILLYAVQLVAVSLILYPAARMGLLYLVAAVALGGIFIVFAVRVVTDGGSRAAMALFRFSITYLALLFAAVAADRLVRA